MSEEKSDLQDTVRRGLAAAAQTRTVADQLTELLERTEQLLESLKLGIPVHVQMNENFELHFRREGSKWRLVLVPFREGNPILVINASLSHRVEVVKHLTNLTEALVSEAILLCKQTTTLSDSVALWLKNLEDHLKNNPMPSV